jgi:hypothetical protein
LGAPANTTNPGPPGVFAQCRTDNLSPGNIRENYGKSRLGPGPGPIRNAPDTAQGWIEMSVP